PLPLRLPTSPYCPSLSRPLCFAHLLLFRFFPSRSPLSFFFLILRVPPTSRLFPYTTLFRSPNRPRGTARRSPSSLRRGADLKETDRKSTRLNSSHVSTSYAVFCLKKKKNGLEQDTSPPNHRNTHLTSTGSYQQKTRRRRKCQ